MTIVTLGIDLGKTLNSVVGLDAEGQRATMPDTFAHDPVKPDATDLPTGRAIRF